MSGFASSAFSEEENRESTAYLDDHDTHFRVKQTDRVPTAETAVFAGLGSDGTSCNGQTHLSCPQAAVRLIEPKRRCCEVKDEVVPSINVAGFGGDIA